MILTNENTRTNLVNLLAFPPGACCTMEDAIGSIRPETRTKRAAPGMHTVWDLVEHIRIVQEDILRYTLDPSWVSPVWPDETWPDHADSITDEMWDSALSGYYTDRDELAEMAMDASLDLAAEFAHGEGRTYLRQIMLAADHTSYHLGQIVIIRKLLGDWKR